MSLKEKLRRNETTIGSWVTLGHSAVAEIMAAAGFDWLVLDMEHSVIDVAAAQEMIQAIDRCGIPSIARLTNNDENLIKRVMDAGATGIMVPMVKSVEDAQRAIDAVYYPPKGTRGVGLARAQGYGASFQEYRRWLGDNAVVVVMIENIKALDEIDALLALPDVDAYIIGPYDLSASMGVPGEFHRPEVAQAIERIQQAGERAGKPGGLHVVDPVLDDLRKRLDQGFRFIGYGMDIRIIDCLCRDHLAKIRTTP